MQSTTLAPEEIKKLETPPQPPVPSSADATAFVNKSSILIFDQNVSAQQQEDVLNSTLLAQLVADHKYSGQSNSKDWYLTYSDILKNIGWDFDGFTFDQFKSNGKEVCVNEAVMNFLESLLSENALVIAKGAISALKGLGNPNKAAASIFNQSHNQQTSGQFQFGNVTKSGDAVELKLGAFYYTSNKKSDDILWVKYANDQVSVFGATAGIILDAEIYEEIRSAIVEKLGSHAKNSIAKLEI